MVVLCHGGRLVDIDIGRRGTVDRGEHAVAGDEMLFLFPAVSLMRSNCPQPNSQAELVQHGRNRSDVFGNEGGRGAYIELGILGGCVVVRSAWPSTG